jgi:Protein of unknown function (DUF2846)
MKAGFLAVLALGVLALVSCAPVNSARLGSEPPPAAGSARLYFYRGALPSESPSWTTVSLNGRPVGDSAPGTVFYRDVPPGRYEIEVRSDAVYPDQFKSVQLRPGSVVFVEVQELAHWGWTGWGRSGTSFAVRLASPAQAQQQMAGLRLTSG